VFFFKLKENTSVGTAYGHSVKVT